jgi:hypothetical protein
MSCMRALSQPCLHLLSSICCKVARFDPRLSLSRTQAADWSRTKTAGIQSLGPCWNNTSGCVTGCATAAHMRRDKDTLTAVRNREAYTTLFDVHRICMPLRDATLASTKYCTRQRSTPRKPLCHLPSSCPPPPTDCEMLLRRTVGCCSDENRHPTSARICLANSACYPLFARCVEVGVLEMSTRLTGNNDVLEVVSAAA